jgi:hypothetical protein
LALTSLHTAAKSLSRNCGLKPVPGAHVSGLR